MPIFQIIRSFNDLDPLNILISLGGREQAAIFGSVIAARIYNIPVLVDGFICTASLAPLFLIKKSSLDHCLFSHCSKEKGHKYLLAVRPLAAKSDPLITCLISDEYFRMG